MDSKGFVKKYILRDDNKNHSDLQKIFSFPIYQRDSILTTDKGFINIDNGKKVPLTGFISLQKLTLAPPKNDCTLIRSEALLISVYFNNYQKPITYLL